MAKFVIVATAVNKNGTWGVDHEMIYGDLKANEFVTVGDQAMAEARCNILNRTRQHGKSALQVIGEQTVRNRYVKLA